MLDNFQSVTTSGLLPLPDPHCFESLSLIVFTLQHVTCLFGYSTLGIYLEESVNRSMVREIDTLDTVVLEKFDFIVT